MLTVGFLGCYRRDSCFRDEYRRILFYASSCCCCCCYYWQGIKPKALVLPEKFQIPEAARVSFPLISVSTLRILCLAVFYTCVLPILLHDPSNPPNLCLLETIKYNLCCPWIHDPQWMVVSPTGPHFKENIVTFLKLSTVSRELGVELHAGMCLA